MFLFLLAVVPVACRRVRSTDYQTTCGTNLSSLGKAMLIYANDYDDELPRSGGRNSKWREMIPNWRASNRYQAYGLSAKGEGGYGSISSCFYLLVKYTEVTPKTFLCPQDEGTKEFEPADEGAGNREIFELWDFGADPTDNCSYSYHMPFCKYALTISSNPGMAVAADRNPFQMQPIADPKDIRLFRVEADRKSVKAANAHQHNDEGQNVLYLDSHVAFEKVPYCGINDDNIYTYWDGGDIRRGAPPVIGSKPQDKIDSLLVHDGQGNPPDRGNRP
jgi:hypothetical protein